MDGILPAVQNALLYETVTVVEGKPILRDMVFSPDHQYIYLLSDRQVNTRSSCSDSNQRSSEGGSPTKEGAPYTREAVTSLLDIQILDYFLCLKNVY